MAQNAKTKGLTGIGFSILFVLLGLYLMIGQKSISGVHPMVIKGIGIACTVFFGAVLIRRFRK